MPNWAKWVMGFLVVAVLYLGIRDYRQAKWMNDHLFDGWVAKYNFTIHPTRDPDDGVVPPRPPPPFGF